MGFTGVIAPLQVELQLVTKPITYKVNSQPTPHKKKMIFKKKHPSTFKVLTLTTPY